MMKNYLLILAIALLVMEAKAQNIGINSTGALPNSSAMLDVDVAALATKKGLLIPRMTAAEKTALNPLPAAAQGLLIYQTDGAQGFYYNTSITVVPFWVYLPSAAASGWALVGNAGTVSTTNFHGTLDSIAVSFRVNNHSSGRIGLLDPADLNTSFGNSAGAAVTTGLGNTAVGAKALMTTTTASNNTAVGNTTLAVNTLGFNNTAIGATALQVNTTGFNLTSLGANTLQANISGNNNTEVGTSALSSNQTGFDNIETGSGSFFHNFSGNNNSGNG